MTVVIELIIQTLIGMVLQISTTYNADIIAKNSRLGIPNSQRNFSILCSVCKCSVVAVVATFFFSEQKDTGICGIAIAQNTRTALQSSQFLENLLVLLLLLF